MAATEIIKPLHGLRGIAAMTVVVGHFAPIKAAPALGVVLFFVLSGFLMGKLYLEQDFTLGNVWSYVVSRVARVYPLFAVVVVGTGLLNWATGAGIFGLELWEVPKHLALAGSANTIWTIATEFHFYGLFIAIWLIRSKFPKSLPVIAPLLLVSVILMLYRGTEAGRIEISGYLHIFIAGLAVAALTNGDAGRWRSIAALALPVLIAGFLVAFVLIPVLYAPRWIYMDLIVVSGCALLLAASLVAGDTFTNRALSIWPLVWLGEVSFGVYLLHRHAQWMVDSVLPEMSSWTSLPIKVVFALILAWIANMIVEKPCRTAIRTAGIGLTERLLKDPATKTRSP